MSENTVDAAKTVAAQGLSRTQTLVIAASAGISVANIYYAQPLLDLMANDVGVSSSSIGLVVTLTQVGYGLGLLVVVPISDLVDRRKLMVVQGLLSAIALVVVATAGAKTILLAGMGAVGLLAVLVQILVAQAAALATPAQRGRVVGTVTSGVVTGILAARSIAGAIADLGGWRAVYLTSALLTVAMVGILVRVLPRRAAEPHPDSYLNALLSVPRTFLREPALRYRGVLAVLIFASFSTFWTALVLPLSAPPFSYSHTLIGLFGLVGLAGAIGATCAGRLADKGYGRWTTRISLTLLLASWGLIAFLPLSISLLLIGVFLLDLAVQAVHVTNLSVVVSLYPQKSGRLIGGYMIFYSVGSAIGAIAATATYTRYDWPGICVLGAAFSGFALVVWIASRFSAKVDRTTCLAACPRG